MYASIRNADQVVVQVGLSLGTVSGCVIVQLTDAQTAELDTLLAQPNGGIVLNADGSFTALPVPTATDPYAADRQTLFNYMPASGSAVSSIVTTFINSTGNDPAERATMAALRALIRVVRGLS